MEIRRVGVVGAGTMGAGIAQLIVQNGYSAIIFDIDEKTVEQAKSSIFSRLDRLVKKKKAGQEEIEQAKRNLKTTTYLQQLKDCQLVIEAVPENIDIKRFIFQQLEEICTEEAILATNTSSISITQISGMVLNPERVAGFHFFNPAPVMPLVEVIKGLKTSPETVESIVAFAKELKKTPVVCKDTPGFIVNRVARPFYNEAIRIMNDQVATIEQIDRIMKHAGNFKMGPFELQDLIGIDVNFATTNSIHDSFYGESRFRPHYYQERMVQSGSLGRKTGGGYFSYDGN
ncbi:3-hydroxybutyryl-CoA dehydrogenase [Bacillus sp. V3-13]|nr:3-hydroxyacyl-CoA dehydrogenase NAD-binding domain-containing protein [Bacillus sp. V3-13]PLR78774.1 3-hydroxybutyryl-CoA dehydrogenase [Bacillus sp. V3-13]